MSALLPTWQFNGTDVPQYSRLPTWQFNGTDVPQYSRLPGFFFSEEGPSTLSVEGAGGVRLYGEAGVPLIYRAEGKVHLRGEAVVSVVNVLRYGHVVSGGLHLAGEGQVPGDYRLVHFGTGGAALRGRALIDDDPLLRYQGDGMVRLSGTALFHGGQVARLSGSGGVRLGSMSNLDAVLPRLAARCSDGEVRGALGARVFAPRSYCYANPVPARLRSALVPLVANFSAHAAVLATMGATLSLPVSDLRGGTQRLRVRLPAIEADVQALVAQVARCAVPLPSPRIQCVASIGRAAAIVASLPLPVQQSAARIGVRAQLVGTVRLHSTPWVAQAGHSARITGRLAVPLFQGRAPQPLSARLQSRFIRPQAQLSLRGQPRQVQTHVMNLESSAVWTYENYPFNSFAEFAGRYLACGPGGLYSLDSGDDDDGHEINACFSTGETDFGSAQLKRCEAVYAGMRTMGDLYLRVQADEGEVFAYALKPYGVSRLKQRRALIGRGLRGKYWRFEIANTNGCDFDLDNLNILLNPTTRGV